MAYAIPKSERGHIWHRNGIEINGDQRSIIRKKNQNNTFLMRIFVKTGLYDQSGLITVM